MLPLALAKVHRRPDVVLSPCVLVDQPQLPAELEGVLAVDSGEIVSDFPQRHRAPLGEIARLSRIRESVGNVHRLVQARTQEVTVALLPADAQFVYRCMG